MRANRLAPSIYLSVEFRLSAMLTRTLAKPRANLMGFATLLRVVRPISLKTHLDKTCPKLGNHEVFKKRTHSALIDEQARLLKEHR